MNNPDYHFHDDSNPSIVEGDWVTSYRGPGQVLSISGDMAKVQLISGSNAIITVPYVILTKMTRAEAQGMVKNLPDTKKELETILGHLLEFISENTKEISMRKSEFTGDVRSTYKFMEDVLLDVISLKKKDAYCPQYESFGKIASSISFLCDLILETTNDREITIKVRALQDKFKEMSL